MNPGGDGDLQKPKRVFLCLNMPSHSSEASGSDTTPASLSSADVISENASLTKDTEMPSSCFSALPPFSPSPHPPPLLVISCALGGTAHSATKQSCPQHRALANQAGPECSGTPISSTPPRYAGGTGGERESARSRRGGEGKAEFEKGSGE
ncbi:hypothetical protein EYF80_034970 [Liparis tanakae]|uniref:Uncharacterized protein n=1 Tax=Liparis tanakae TaxID=230148 RepID=A0A4Z2GNI8_9TELE|nr:hypothetical protein EYF80_034970 [Liparis tanakae]